MVAEARFKEAIMRYSSARVLSLLCFFGLLTACGNTLRARGTVLHPMYKYRQGDTEAPRPPRLLVIQRRENRVVVKHTIVGPQGRPMALRILGEFAEIPGQDTDGNGLLVEVLLFSNYKDELSSMSNYQYWLELPDGRKVKGEVHVQHARKDHSVKITGMHMEPHLVVRDKQNKTVTVYRHVEEVENDLEMYSRWGRILFQAKGLITPKTPYVIFVVKGYWRERRYRFDFTHDPYKAMGWAAEHLPGDLLDPLIRRK